MKNYIKTIFEFISLEDYTNDNPFNFKEIPSMIMGKKHILSVESTGFERNDGKNDSTYFMDSYDISLSLIDIDKPIAKYLGEAFDLVFRQYIHKMFDEYDARVGKIVIAFLLDEADDNRDAYMDYLKENAINEMKKYPFARSMKIAVDDDSYFEIVLTKK